MTVSTNNAGALASVQMVIVNDGGVLKRVNVVRANNAGAMTGDVYSVIKVTSKDTSAVVSAPYSYTTNWSSTIPHSRTTQRVSTYTTYWNSTTNKTTQGARTVYTQYPVTNHSGEYTVIATQKATWLVTTTSVPMSRTTSGSVDYTTKWSSTIPHSRTTTVSGSRTSHWNTAVYLRLTADNAGGYKYTAVLSAGDYGHSYVADGVWVET